MSKLIYFIDRYDNSVNQRNHSGYETLPAFMPAYERLTSASFLNAVLKKILAGQQPKNYIWSNASKELKGVFKAIVLNRPIHYLYGDKDAFLSILLKKRLGIKRLKLFATLHWPLRELDAKRLSELRYFDRVIVMGQSMSQDVAPYVNSVAYIPHGIDLKFWRRSSEYTKRVSKTILIIGSSNRNHKAQQGVMRELLKLDSSVKFIVVNRIEEQRAEYNEIPNTTVLDNYVDDVAFRELYENAMGVVLIQNNCIASNVVLESMAMGVPVLANNVGDISDYLGADYNFFVSMDHLSNRLLSDFLSAENRILVSNRLTKRSGLFDWHPIARRTQEYFDTKLKYSHDKNIS